MPIYEYRCASCGETFEVFQKASDDGSSLRCEFCGHERVERMFSAFATSGGSSSSSLGSYSGGSSCGSRGGFS